MNNSRPKPLIISHLFEAVYPSFAMLAGMELDLFTELTLEPLTVEALADAIGVVPVKLRPLLYALVVAGLLTVEDDRFANTPEADHYLVRGKPSYLGAMREITASNWSRVLNTAGAIRAGRPLETLDYHALPHDELVAAFRGFYSGAVSDARRLMKLFDFSSRRALLDVGGGSGGLAIAMVQANPQLKATVADLPLVTPITRQFVDEASVADRVQVLTADAVRETLTGSYDVIVARHVIQVLSDADSRALLHNLAAILRPGGVIHLVGWILDDARVSPHNTVGLNLVLLTAYQDGQAYTEGEYRRWLAETGFVGFERESFPDGASIVTARKPR